LASLLFLNARLKEFGVCLYVEIIIRYDFFWPLIATTQHKKAEKNVLFNSEQGKGNRVSGVDATSTQLQRPEKARAAQITRRFWQPTIADRGQARTNKSKQTVRKR
jgi:hypothetical protein